MVTAFRKQHRLRHIASCAVLSAVVTVGFNFAGDRHESLSVGVSVEDFRKSAHRAIRSLNGAVLVVTIRASVYDSGPGHTTTNVVAVDEAIKLPRTDDRVYFVPTTVYNMPKKDGLFLKRGRKYVAVVKDLSFLDTAIELTGAATEVAMLTDLRKATAESAKHGSTSDLSEKLEPMFDEDGIRTLRADGSVDPGAFGLDANAVNGYVKAGAGIYVVSYRGRDLNDIGHWPCDLIEHLSGPNVPAEFKVQRVDEGKGVAGRYVVQRPYVKRIISTFRPLCIVVTRKINEDLQVERRVPLIGFNDRCLQSVREWIRQTSVSESRPTSRPKADRE